MREDKTKQRIYYLIKNIICYTYKKCNIMKIISKTNAWVSALNKQLTHK